MVSGLNHVMHQIEENVAIKKFIKKNFGIFGSEKGLKQYFAIVIGESSGRLDAQGIGEVIIRRLQHVGGKLTDDFYNLLT